MLFLFLNFVASDTFLQDIDHGNISLTRKFHQRYSVLKTHPEHSSIIIYLCGMSSLEECNASLETSTILQISKRTHSVIYCLEHRFYGKSLPFSDISPKSLQYLSIDQVIDDVGTFATYLQTYKCFNQKCRVLLVGEGYSGSIAVWTKQQYPDLIDSVWAISSPLAASNSYDSKEIYYSSILDEYFPDCLDNISISMKKINDQFILNNATYIYQFFEYFGLSNETFPIEKNALYAMSSFIYELIDLWISSDLNPLDKYCSILNTNNFLSSTKTILDKINKTLNDYNPTWETDKFDDILRNKHLQSYQFCTELGWIPVSTPLYYIKRILPFSFNSNYVSENICFPLFNITFQNRNHFNVRHGGQDTGVQSVIYTSAIKGIYQNLLYDQNDYLLNDRREVIKLSFSDWKSSPKDPQGVEDSDELITARNTAIETLTEWLTIDNKCQHGRVYLHNCVCDEHYAGKYCDSRARTKEYDSLSIIAVVVPTFMMLTIGIIAWFVFIVSSKTTKLIC